MFSQLFHLLQRPNREPCFSLYLVLVLILIFHSWPEVVQTQNCHR
jgi:hypothetical protein